MPTKFSIQALPGRNELFLLLGIAVLLGGFIVHLGNDFSLLELIQRPIYFQILGFAVLLSLLLLVEVRWVVSWTHSLGWRNSSLKKLGLHLLFGVAIPLGVILLLSYVYADFVGVSYRYFFRMDTELPFSILVLILMNIAFEVRMYIHQHARKEVGNLKIEVTKGSETKYLPVAEISYFYLAHSVVKAVDVNNNAYLVSESLNKLESMVGESFFRLNRQALCSRHAISGFSTAGNQKLNVHIKSDGESSIIVSKEKATAFKKWLKQ